MSGARYGALRRLVAAVVLASPLVAVPAAVRAQLSFHSTAQQVPPMLEVKLDRSRLAVGEELMMYVTATSRSAEPLQVTLAPIDGLAIVGRSERTEIAYNPTPTRTTTLEIRLRALRQGRWQLGPVIARQGSDTVRAAAVAVQVADAPAGGTLSLSPRVARLLQRAAPPRPGQPSLSIVLSADSARVGEQVDLVTIAWFPRDLRLRLRRPPVLQPPTMDGVWSYPQAAPTGVVATRRVGAVTYELFVAHQVVFPVMPGRLATSSAVLKYSVPLALQFFSQEESFQLTADPAHLAVSPLPAGGKPAGFPGAVAHGLTLARTAAPGPARVGQAFTVEYAVEGEGNLALWPAPELAWPKALRAYSDRVDEHTELVQGVMRGRKRFRYLVVPDSVGTYVLPGATYAYFDAVEGAYHAATTPPGAVAVGGTGEATSKLQPPALLSDAAPAPAWRLAGLVPTPLWIVLWLLPPVAALAARHPLWRSRRRAIAPPAAPQRTLEGVEAELDALLRSLVPEVSVRSGPGLGPALRAAGVDAALARRVVEVRDHVLARRYGPQPTDTPSPELLANVAEVLDRLGAVRRLSRRSRPLAALGIALVVAAAGSALRAAPLLAQAPSAEQLYRSGSLRAAAEAFARRAEREPAVAAHWYALGASLYRMGDENRAAAAWYRAARLAPRDQGIRHALRLVPPDPVSAAALWVPPVTPEELLLVGTLCWVVGWSALLGQARRRDLWLGLAVVGGVAGLGGVGLARWYARPLALVVADTQLHRSPYGRAEGVGPVGGGTAVSLVRHIPGWVLVRGTGDGAAEGWMPAEALAVVHE